ncbi:hypothetical protein ZWY2020_041705 [Hordeum vulgare]|nr:hypothetical protein ZWY2020_041705 [Hordeum vulgare]
MPVLGMAHRRGAHLHSRLRPTLSLRNTRRHLLVFYSIAIDSATGLDPPSPTDFSMARPEFNLTFRLLTNGLRRSVCVDVGIYAEVSYRCVPLAANPVTPHARTGSASGLGRRATSPCS